MRRALGVGTEVGAMDVLASRCLVGPKVHSCSQLGMVMDFLPGDTLQEAMDAMAGPWLGEPGGAPGAVKAGACEDLIESY